MIGYVGKGKRGDIGLSCAKGIEEADLADVAHPALLLAKRHRAVQPRQELAAAAATQSVAGARLDQAFYRATGEVFAVGAGKYVGQRGERATLAARLDEFFDGPRAHVFDGDQPKAYSPARYVRGIWVGRQPFDGEASLALVDVRRQDLDAHR